MLIHKIVSFLKTHKKIFLLGGFIIGILFLLGDSAFAAVDAAGAGGGGGAGGSSSGSAGSTDISKEDLNKIVSILNGFITGISAIMGMVTSFISMFLYPGWVNGTLFGLQDYLKIIWIMISNIVYFAFAFILIAIAFMNIIGKGEGTWELKQAMPKFIVGVLIVPFSWFIVQFILSLSAILTVGVLTLPYNSFGSEDLYQSAIEELGDEKICKDIIITFANNPGSDGSTALSGSDGEALSENIRCKDDGGEVKIADIFTGEGDGAGLQNSVFGIISVYTYGILQIQNMDTITGKDLESISTVADLVFKIVFDLLFIVVYLLLMVALLLALFVRGIRLWIFMMLSPAFGLLYFFGKTGDGGKLEKFNVKEFIALAMVPVYVAAALAFGMVFIMVASQGIKENHDVMEEDTLSVGGFSITIKGAHGNGASEKSVIGKLIVEIFGVVILWIAVMAALGASKTTEAIVKPIADFGNSVGELAAKAPTYAPIIPTGRGEMQSAQSLQKIGTTLTGNVQADSTRRASKFFGQGGEAPDTLAADRISERANGGQLSDHALQAAAAQEILITANGNMGNLYNDTKSRKALYDVLRAVVTDADKLERAGITSAASISSPDMVAKVYALLEQALPDKDIIPGVNGSAIRERHIEDALRTAPGNPITTGETPPTGDTVNLNLTDITVENAETRASAMTGLISERDLRAKLVLADIEESQYDGIITAFRAVGKIEEES